MKLAQGTLVNRLKDQAEFLTDLEWIVNDYIATRQFLVTTFGGLDLPYQERTEDYVRQVVAHLQQEQSPKHTDRVKQSLAEVLGIKLHDLPSDDYLIQQLRAWRNKQWALAQILKSALPLLIHKEES